MRKRTDFVTSMILYAFIFLPAVFGFLYVRAFGVSVVFDDAWSTVLLFDAWSSGALGASDFLRPLNEHILPVPKIVSLLLGIVTAYDNVAEMYLMQACFLTTLVVCLLAFRNGSRLWLLLFIPISLLIFSFRQHVNMLFGFQINFAFTQTFGVLAFFVLHILQNANRKNLLFAAAMASGSLASFSTAQGLFVWPVGLLQLLFGAVEKSRKRIFAAIWGAVGLGHWATYFIIGSRLDSGPSLLYGLINPTDEIRYFLNLLGSSLFWRPDFALAGGLLLACLALAGLVFTLKDGKLSGYSFWAALLLYSALALAAITVGRSEFGAAQALANRYTTISIMVVVGIYAMLAKVAFERRSSFRVALYAVISGIVIMSAVVSYPRGIEAGGERMTSMEEAAAVLATYETQTDEALEENLSASAQFVRAHAPTLQRLNYNVFSEERD